MKKQVLFVLILVVGVLFACKTDAKKEDTAKGLNDSASVSSALEEDTLQPDTKEQSQTDTIKVPELFSINGFDSTVYYNLLIETHLCNPNYTDTTSDGTYPCSAKFFRFFPYNHNRDINDAFILQVKAGVNGYPYRRLLVFVRERGKLVLMNGIVGYLYKRIPQPNGIDDLIVGIIDDLGNDHFSRYDVLLRYKDGKYRFVEALGDLKGKFDNPELKKRATKAIHNRIKQKHLIF